MTADPCPPSNTLRCFVLGRVGDDDARRVARHVERCDFCESMLQQFEDRSDAFLDVMSWAAGPKGVVDEPECERAVQRAGTLVADESHLSETIGRLVQPPLPASGEIRDYVLLETLGEGGMGMVYKAVHTRLQRPVALKVIRPDRTESPRAVDRFRREMRAVGRLNHPNIVRATDAGEADGIHYLVMELVDGENLSQIVQRHGPLRVADACELIRQAAVGLGHAHQRGLVHRDVKPSNLMLTAAEQNTPGLAAGAGAIVKILDLGLAWLTDANERSENLDALADDHATAADGDFGVLPDADTDAVARRQEATLTTHVVGTRDYMAPEQSEKRKSLDQRADVYSLGATLHKLLWGRPPRHPKSQHPGDVEAFDDSSTIQISLRDDVPEELCLIVSKMLNARPEDRWQDMGEVVAALEPFCAVSDLPALLRGEEGAAVRGPTSKSDQPGLQDPAGKRLAQRVARKRAFNRLIATLAVLALAGVAIAFSLGHREDDDLNSVTLRLDEANRSPSGRDSAPVVSPEQAEALKALKGSVPVPPDDFALRLDGQHYVEIADTSELTNADDTFTVEFWIRTFHDKEKCAWMGDTFFPQDVGRRLDQSGVPVGWLLGFSYNHRLKRDQVLLSYGARDVDNRGRAWWVKVQRGDWHHFAFCHHPDRMSLYQNGKRLWVHHTNRPEKPPADSPSNIFLGCPKDDSIAKMCRADIRAFRLSKGIRYEAKRFSPSRKFKKDDDTLVLLDFTKGEGNVIADLSGHERHGDIVGAQWVTLNAKLPPRRKRDNANLAQDGSDVAAGGPAMNFNELTTAIRRDPQSVEPFLHRYAANTTQGLYDEAIADCNEVLRTDPKHLDARYYRGKAYISKRRFDEAIADCNELIRLDPKHVRAFFLRGIAYSLKGQFDRAITDYTETIRLQPTNAIAYKNRSRCYVALGDNVKASADLTMAIKLGLEIKINGSPARRGPNSAVEKSARSPSVDPKN